jgi:CheY-like chemotaxis protein
MEVHDGSISVYSEGEGTGSCFIVDLPIIHHSNYNISSETISVDNNSYHDDNRYSSISDNYNNNNNQDDPINKIDNLLQLPPLLTSSNIPSVISCNCPDDVVINNMNDISILIVDDSAMNRKMLKRLLTERVAVSPISGEKYHYNITEYEDGLEALNRITHDLEQGISHLVKIILIDYQMPVMDGIVAVKAMRDKGYRGYIVMITGNALQDDQANMYAAGVNSIMIKPIQKEKLFQLIDNNYSNSSLHQ